MDSSISDSTLEVSLLTPTYERNIFFPILSEIISCQTYDLKKTEWIIIDDSVESSQEYFQSHELKEKLYNLIYIHLPKKKSIGEKRNLCNLLASGNYLINIDDDDYYNSRYIELIIHILKTSKYQVCGASEISYMFSNSNYIYQVGPYGSKRTCAGIMSYTKEYAKQNMFDNFRTFAEEQSFLRNFSTEIFQIPDSYKYNLALKHSFNSANKDFVKFRKNSNMLWIMYVDSPYIQLQYIKMFLNEISLIDMIKSNCYKTYKQSSLFKNGFAFYLLKLLFKMISKSKSSDSND
jgi:glycosyltransferase involved in cell wall biosynthesis